MNPDCRFPPFDQLAAFADLFDSHWATDLSELNRHAAQTLPHGLRFHFIDPLQPDGLHYEARIAERGEIAMRPGSWHDFYGALMWLAFPLSKAAINQCQVADLRVVGPKQRTRHQQAITHVDEAGMILAFDVRAPLERLYEHDWNALLFAEREAWAQWTEVLVIGHSLFELRHQRPQDLLAAKVLPIRVDANYWLQDGETRRKRLDATVAAGLTDHALAADPKDLPTLPLSAIAGWDARNVDPDFVASARCFRPRPAGRVYAAPVDIQPDSSCLSG